MATPFPFVAGAVLEAAELNAITELPSATKTSSYTLVAGDAGTRVVMNVASANTATINNSLFSAGQIVQISNIGAGVTTVTPGAGVTINSADVLTLAQYQGGSLVFSSASAAVWFPTAKTVSAGGLTYLTGAAFSAQTSVAFANDTFSSTYDYYLVMLDAAGDSAGANVSVQVRDNSGTKSTANYAGGGVGQLFNNSQSTFGVNGATSFALMQATVGPAGRNRYGLTMFVSSPASSTKATIWNGTATADPQTGASIGGWHYGGEYGVEETHTGLVFTFSVASSGLYRVYGLANS